MFDTWLIKTGYSLKLVTVLQVIHQLGNLFWVPTLHEPTLGSFNIGPMVDLSSSLCLELPEDTRPGYD